MFGVHGETDVEMDPRHATDLVNLFAHWIAIQATWSPLEAAKRLGFVTSEGEASEQAMWEDHDMAQCPEVDFICRGDGEELILELLEKLDDPDQVAGVTWAEPDGRLVCDVCPRHCRLTDGQRGLSYTTRSVVRVETPLVVSKPSSVPRPETKRRSQRWSKSCRTGNEPWRSIAACDDWRRSPDCDQAPSGEQP